jgi:bacterioferritin-associated ferredoxin
MKLRTTLKIVVIVCLCRAVSDRVVRLAVAQGARTVAQVAKSCGAGRGCGACHEDIRRLATAGAPDVTTADCVGGSVPVPCGAMHVAEGAENA